MNALLQPAPDRPVHRPMTTVDIDRVLDVERQAYAFPWTRGNFTDSLAAGYWAQMRLGGDGRLLGYALAMPAVDELHLLNLTVAPAFEGRGHARALLDALQDFGRAQGLRSLWLEVRVGNQRALRLYEHLQFATVGRRPGYYPAPGGQREEAIVMSLHLGAGHELD